MSSWGFGGSDTEEYKSAVKDNHLVTLGTTHNPRHENPLMQNCTNAPILDSCLQSNPSNYSFKEKVRRLKHLQQTSVVVTFRKGILTSQDSFHNQQPLFLIFNILQHLERHIPVIIIAKPDKIAILVLVL